VSIIVYIKVTSSSSYSSLSLRITFKVEFYSRFSKLDLIIIVEYSIYTNRYLKEE